LTLKQALRHAREVLSRNGIEDAPLESELLLRHALNIDRVQLYIDLEKELPPWQEQNFRRLLKRRLSGEPAAYITGHREFYGLEFRVNRNVLIPRPESELLVEMALAIAKNQPLPVIADIGTGSGALAISLALGLPQAKIYATDISAAALKVARLNCRRHGVADRVFLLEGDLLEPLPEPVDIIVANLPYVRKSELDPRSEPPLALDGGADGTEMIEKLCRQVAGKLKPGGWLLLEIGQGQGEEIKGILHNTVPGGEVKVFPDLAGIGRVVICRLSAGLAQLDRQCLRCYIR
jgi:release factor glutamine methyltransferase